MHHRTIEINHQPDATILQFIILTFIYSSTSFGLCCAVFVVGPARPRTQHDCHHDTKVKPETATAVIELLMMGGKTPETCWAVNKRQDNKLENCCIRLVIYLNSFVMSLFIRPTWHVNTTDAKFATCFDSMQEPVCLLCWQCRVCKVGLINWILHHACYVQY